MGLYAIFLEGVSRYPDAGLGRLWQDLERTSDSLCLK